MKPEGPNNVPLVILKAIILPAVIGSATIYPMSGFLSSMWGVPFYTVFVRFSVFLSILYIVTAVAAGCRGRLMSAEVQFADKDRFVSQVTAALVGQQFQPAFSEGSLLTFKPQLWSYMYDAVTINLGEGTAHVVGPSFCVKCVLDAATAA